MSQPIAGEAPGAEYSVYVFLADGGTERMAQFVGAKQAAETARRLIGSAMGQTGVIRRLIITDGGDATTFEWRFDRGVTRLPEQSVGGRVRACPVCGGVLQHLWNCSLNQPGNAGDGRCR